MCAPQQVRDGRHLKAGRRRRTTAALLLSSFWGAGVKEVAISKQPRLCRSKSKGNWVDVPTVLSDPPASHPQSRGPKEKKSRRAAEKGQDLWGATSRQQHRYLHETSTPGHQDPLHEAAGRTRRLFLAWSRHFSAPQRQRRRARWPKTRGTRLHDVLRHGPPPTRSKEVSSNFRVVPDHSARGRAGGVGWTQAQFLGRRARSNWGHSETRVWNVS